MISKKQKEMLSKVLVEDADRDIMPHERSEDSESQRHAEEEEKHEESQDTMSQRKSENKKLQKHEKEHKRKRWSKDRHGLKLSKSINIIND